MADFKEQGEGSPPQNPEWKHDFSPGPSEEELARFKSPEWRSKLPDIRMMADDAEKFGASGNQEELEKYLEALRAERAGERYESGHAIEATLSKHPNPETLLSAVRSLRLQNEEIITGGEMPNDYVVGRQAEILADRRLATSRTFKELQQEELVQPLEEEALDTLRDMRAKGLLPKHMRHETFFGRPLYSAGYGLGETTIVKEAEESWEKDSEEQKKNPRFRTSHDTVVYYGDDDQRTSFSERCGQMEAEILVRHLIMKNWKNYSFQRENLTGLVQLYFGPVPTIGGLEVLFNLSSNEGVVDRTPTDVELRHFGDKIDMARRLYFVNALCQKPDKFKELMETPGWEEFLFPSGADPNEVKKWIGLPGKWKPEDEPHRGEIRTRRLLAEENGAITKDTIKKLPDGTVKKDWISTGYDLNKDVRGLLTRGNIFAQSDPQRDEELHEAIRVFLGGRKDADRKSQVEARSAQLLAYRLFKLWLEADEEGYEIYYNPDQKPALGLFAKKELEFENGPAASDFGKLTAPALYALKSYRKATDFGSHRDFGPEGAFGKYPRFCVSFLRTSSVPVEIEVEGERRIEERSLHELWWGNPQKEIDGVIYPEEPALRMGDLPWKELKGALKRDMLTPEEARVLGIPWEGMNDEALVVLYLSTFMAGREEKGFYTLGLQTTWDERMLMDPSFWLRLSKAIDVGIKPGVATFGIFRAKSKDEIRNATGNHKRKIIDTFWEGITSTADYQRWLAERVPVGKGLTKDETVTVVEKIRRVAAKAGLELKRLNASHTLPEV